MPVRLVHAPTSARTIRGTEQVIVWRTDTSNVSPAPAVIPRTRVGAGRQLLLAAYWFSLSVQNGAWVGVAVPAQVLRITSNGDKALVLGLLAGFGSLAGMLAQPIVGVMSDLSRSRWGRRRPYLVGGALIDVAGLGLMIVASNLALLFAGFLLANLGNAASGAAYQAYLPDHVPPEQYGEASGYVGAVTMFGTMVSFGAAGVLVTTASANPFYFLTAAVIATGALLTAVAIPDPAVAPVHRAGTWRSVWLTPWHNNAFLLVFVTRAMMMLALYTLFTFVEYYVRDVVHVTQFVQGASVVAGLATVAALGGGIITGWLSDRVGRKRIVSGAGLVMAGSLAVLAFVHHLDVVLATGVVFGLSLGAFSAVDWALAIDVLPDFGFVAKDLGLWSISANLPQTVAPFLGGAVLVALAPFGPAAGYGALFLGASLCAAASSALIWRIRGIR